MSTTTMVVLPVTNREYVEVKPGAMIPVIALVGRPNVGKSTLFNRLTRSRNALVADVAGLTRDRQYGPCEMNGRECILIDTGGITNDAIGIDEAMLKQSRAAIEECDLAVLIVDGRAGLTPVDTEVLQSLRVGHKPFMLVVNKADGGDEEQMLSDFHQLGVADMLAISAAHGRGISTLKDEILRHFPEEETADVEGADDDAEDDQARRVKVAVVGRPNVGKSTLVNRILGEERVVVFDMPGTTRDSIFIDFEREEKRYTLIDTAGVRRRRSVSEAIEKFSIVKTLQAIAESNVALVLIDAQEGIVEQDIHLLGQVIDSGKSLIIVCNKWDGLDSDHKQRIKDELDRRLIFAQFAEVFYISALHGSNVGLLYGAIDRAFRSALTKLPTNRLTRILEDAVQSHSPPMINGRRIKLRYAHPGGSNPPVIVVHGNQTERVPDHYKRYLENIFRRELKLVGTPLRVEFVTTENPFAGRKNTLTPRQEIKRKRMMKHIKKRSR